MGDGDKFCMSCGTPAFYPNEEARAEAAAQAEGAAKGATEGEFPDLTSMLAGTPAAGASAAEGFDAAQTIVLEPVDVEAEAVEGGAVEAFEVEAEAEEVAEAAAEGAEEAELIPIEGLQEQLRADEEALENERQAIEQERAELERRLAEQEEVRREYERLEQERQERERLEQERQRLAEERRKVEEQREELERLRQKVEDEDRFLRMEEARLAQEQLSVSPVDTPMPVAAAVAAAAEAAESESEEGSGSEDDAEADPEAKPEVEPAADAEADPEVGSAADAEGYLTAGQKVGEAAAVEAYLASTTILPKGEDETENEDADDGATTVLGEGLMPTNEMAAVSEDLGEAVLEPPVHPYLMRIGSGERLYFTPPAVLGKGSTADIRIPNNSNISREHVRIECEKGEYFIIDLGSTNGTEVDGERIAKDALCPLREGATVTLADERFAFGVEVE